MSKNNGNNSSDNDRDLKQFDSMVSNLGEHFKEYVLIAKGSNGNMLWRSSDRTWAMGACQRYLITADQEDRMLTMEEGNEELEGGEEA